MWLSVVSLNQSEKLDRNALFDTLLTDNPTGEQVKLPGISDEFMKACRMWDPVAEMHSWVSSANKDRLLVSIQSLIDCTRYTSVFPFHSALPDCTALVFR